MTFETNEINQLMLVLVSENHICYLLMNKFNKMLDEVIKLINENNENEDVKCHSNQEHN